MSGPFFHVIVTKFSARGQKDFSDYCINIFHKLVIY